MPGVECRNVLVKECPSACAIINTSKPSIMVAIIEILENFAYRIRSFPIFVSPTKKTEAR